MAVNRDNRCRGGGAVSKGGHHNEGVPPQQCVVSAGHPAATGRTPSSGAAVHETRRSAALHTLREESGINNDLIVCFMNRSLLKNKLKLMQVFVFVLEPHCKGSHWLRASGC